MLRNIIKIFLIKRNNQKNFLIPRKLQTTPNFLVEEESQSIDKHVNRINELFSKYNTEQRERILKIINNYNLNELLG